MLNQFAKLAEGDGRLEIGFPLSAGGGEGLRYESFYGPMSTGTICRLAYKSHFPGEGFRVRRYSLYLHPRS